jgi:hypothetical protein
VITSRKFQGSDTFGFTNRQRIAFASTRKRKKGSRSLRGSPARRPDCQTSRVGRCPGLPIRILTSEGQAWDGHRALQLLDYLKPDALLLADRGYDFKPTTSKSPNAAPAPIIPRRRSTCALARSSIASDNLIELFFFNGQALPRRNNGSGLGKQAIRLPRLRGSSEPQTITMRKVITSIVGRASLIRGIPGLHLNFKSAFTSPEKSRKPPSLRDRVN